MKFILNIGLILTFIIGLSPKETLGASNGGYFVVTAYYSPLPNQKHYLTGDYESEKRLNGQGIAGASGKPVFSGMIAAPKNYKFGTKIYLEGLGIGEVSDRGGAIVNAGNRGYSYDRLDIWVGYGDEGLQRALYWGKRTVKGSIVSDSKKVTLDYNNLPSPSWAASGLNSKMSVFTYGLGKGSDSKKVKKLQEFLSEIGLYSGKIDGIYNSELIDIVYYFQVKNGIINKGDLYGAGYWGKDTRSLFKKMYLAGEFDKDSEVKLDNNKKDLGQEKNDFEEKIEPKKIELSSIEKKILNYPVNYIEEKKEVQKIFKKIGTYSGIINGDNKDFISSVYDFQITNSIVNSEYDIGAGTYGPKTRKTLKKVYLEFLERREQDRVDKLNLELEEKKKKAEEEKRKKDLEEKYNIIEKTAEQIAEEKISKIGNVKFGDVSHSVRELQKTLIELGYLNTKDTAIFGNKTRNAVINFQLDNDILPNRESVGAGIVGPKTLSSLKETIINIHINNSLTKTENKDLLEIVNIEKNEA